MFTSWKDDILKSYREHCAYLSNTLVEETQLRLKLMDIITKLEKDLDEKTTQMNDLNQVLRTYEEKLTEHALDVHVEKVIENAISNNGIVKEKDYTKLSSDSEDMN